jgi:hypothetical protein
LVTGHNVLGSSSPQQAKSKRCDARQPAAQIIIQIGFREAAAAARHYPPDRDLGAAHAIRVEAAGRRGNPLNHGIPARPEPPYRRCRHSGQEDGLMNASRCKDLVRRWFTVGMNSGSLAASIAISDDIFADDFIDHDGVGTPHTAPDPAHRERDLPHRRQPDRGELGRG